MVSWGNSGRCRCPDSRAQPQDYQALHWGYAGGGGCKAAFLMATPLMQIVSSVLGNPVFISEQRKVASIDEEIHLHVTQFCTLIHILPNCSSLSEEFLIFLKNSL